MGGEIVEKPAFINLSSARPAFSNWIPLFLLYISLLWVLNNIIVESKKSVNFKLTTFQNWKSYHQRRSLGMTQQSGKTFVKGSDDGIDKQTMGRFTSHGKKLGRILSKVRLAKTQQSRTRFQMDFVLTKKEL